MGKRYTARDGCTEHADRCQLSRLENTVGKVGQHNLISCGSDLNKAKEIFEKKFLDKTKNTWSNRVSFEKVAGKYDLLTRDYSGDAPADEVLGHLAAPLIGGDGVTGSFSSSPGPRVNFQRALCMVGDSLVPWVGKCVYRALSWEDSVSAIAGSHSLLPPFLPGQVSLYPTVIQ
ncbi:uncharacterized protein LOC122543761 isoform X2 [Chiloscyllium plagiosum]|uniref:uncharacterized protein LOC122543761 isoform X2 n=1 Tax=Chiloscyllium plagiosum TaxID=36176 RepID=UPI001CB7CADF|nr:uncharacterized protein LOC122543761 isoform X2 [Chiloscyllium plagiosum]